jgi:hypothetical protein
MPNLRISELDFDDIKQNLKTFLSSYRDDDNKLIFQDYDFEGSGLSVLIDLLAYNTHYNAYLANMLANEAFLDSAVKRDSAVSLAKHLGYTPLSNRSAKALVSFNVTNPIGQPQTLTLPRYTVFNSDVNGNLFSFVNVQPVTIEPFNGVYRFANVEITEGAHLEYTYRVFTPGPDEKYEIPNDNIDTTTMFVTVQNSVTDTTTTVYSLMDDLSDISGLSNVYYLEENYTGRYQIYFGEGTLGRKLFSGNLVRIEYLVSRGVEGNVANVISQSFSCGENIGGGVISSVTTTRNSTGGGLKDTISDIKFKAPKFLESYNRAVTASDYKSIIEANYPFIESVSVWGGDENSPPIYGKVFIALKPYSGYVLSFDVKESIKRNVLSNKKVMSIIPEIIDPEYIYVNIDSTVTYNTKVTALLPNDIKNLVSSEILLYFNRDLQKFDKDFIFSRLSRLMDVSDKSIIGNITKIKIQKRIEPIINVNNNFSLTNSIKFNNSLVPGTMESTRFIIQINSNEEELLNIPVIMYDVPNTDSLSSKRFGTISLKNAESEKIINLNFGIIDYDKGILSIDNLNFIGYPEDTFNIRITVEPQNYNIQTIRNEILLLDDSTLLSAANRKSGINIKIISSYE